MRRGGWVADTWLPYWAFLFDVIRRLPIGGSFLRWLVHKHESVQLLVAILNFVYEPLFSVGLSLSFSPISPLSLLFYLLPYSSLLIGLFLFLVHVYF